MERISSGWSDSTGEDIDGNDLEIRFWSQIIDTNCCQTISATLGSRRGNWKFREKAWEKSDTELLLHSSYSLWPSSYSYLPVAAVWT